MNSFKLNSKLVALIMLTLVIFSACQKETIIPTENLIQPEQPIIIENTGIIAENIEIINGILSFQNDQDYRSTLIALNRMDASEQLNWETKMGFISMQQIFNKIAKAEWINNEITHSSIYNEALDNEIIIEENGYYDLNIFHPAYAPILNKDGIVKIGNEIFQFTNEDLKVWRNGDIHQLEIIQNAKISTPDIEIISMDDETLISRNSSIWNSQCESGIDGGRMIMTGIFYSDFLIDGLYSIIFIKYSINIKSQIQNNQGDWIYDNEAIAALQGNSHTQIAYSDGNNTFIKNFQHNHSANGAGGNYYYIPDVAGVYQLNDPYYFIEPAHLMNCNWKGKNILSMGSGFACQITH